MSIWFKDYNIEDVVKSYGNTILDTLGIEVYELGENYIKGKMPVDERHVQPIRLLHGGASVVLTESLGSIGANLVVDPSKYFALGLEVNANHVRSVAEGAGFVYGTATPFHIGRKTQIWNIEVRNEQEKLVCVSRLTMTVMERK